MNRFQTALREVPLFNEFSQRELKVIAQAATVRRYEKNEVIIHKLERGDTFFSIIDGRVKVILSDEDGKEFIVDVLKPKEFFGELALLDGEPRSATVVAQEPTEVLVLTREEFLNQLKKHPELGIKIMRVLGRRLRRANQRIESLAFMDVCGRLAGTLIDLAASSGEKQSDGVNVPLDFSRTELANLVGTTRETLTRALRTLQSMGYIKIKKKFVVVTNMKGLEGRM
ncbi:MAG: Crp/Fnr family transcriptional regulator [bacterium]